MYNDRRTHDLHRHPVEKLKIEPSNIFPLNHIIVYTKNCSYKRQGLLFKPKANK
jgi:hypothetical protein